MNNVNKIKFKSNILFWYFLLSVLVISLLGSVFYTVVENNNDYFMIALGILPAIMLVYIQIQLKSNDIFSPINFILLSTFIGVTLQTSNIVLGSENLLNFSEDLYSGLFAINLGIFFLILGFLIKTKPAVPNLKIVRCSEWSLKRVYLVVSIITIVSLYAFYLYFQIFNISDNFFTTYSMKRRVDVSTGTGVSYTSYGYVTWLVDLIQIAFFLLLTVFLGSMLRNKARGLKLILSLLIVLSYGLASMFMPFISSSRLLLFLVIIIALMIVNYAYKAISIKKIIIFIVVAAVISSTMESLRTVQTKGLDEGVFKESTSFSSVYKVFAESDNFLGVSKTSILVNSVPEQIDFQYGRTFFLWVIAPIPRTYWPDKPIIKIGGVLGEAVYGRPSGSGVPPGFVGELYLNLGWFGIPIGMFLLGLWLRYLYSNFRRHSHNKNVILIYILTVIPSTFILLVGEFSGVVIHILTSVIPLYIVLTFITVPKRDKYRSYNYGK